ncbi:hypothetical protein M758_4G216800 [Ceratodon purpureus]|nr:hypothetical protein M758_4G216800 [Ceratodon purpureus]
MAVHFKFTASQQFDFIPVAGDSIALQQFKDELFDLKFRPALEKRKRKVKEAFDFRVFDEETKEEILGASSKIRRHSRVLVKRVPAYVITEVEVQQALQSLQAREISNHCESGSSCIDDGFGEDVYSTSSVSCVTSERDSSGNSASISNCTTSSLSKEVHETSFVVSADRKVVRPRVLQARRRERMVKDLGSKFEVAREVRLKSPLMLRKVEIPLEFTCSLCTDSMKEPVLVRCCGASFCKKCVTDAFVVHKKCPSCGSPKCQDLDFLPNPALKDCIDKFQRKQ